jgi:hypothetical protein
MMHVLRDIAGVELPGYLGRLAEDPAEGPAEGPADGATEAVGALPTGKAPQGGASMG